MKKFVELEFFETFRITIKYPVITGAPRNAVIRFLNWTDNVFVNVLDKRGRSFARYNN